MTRWLAVVGFVCAAACARQEAEKPLAGIEAQARAEAAERPVLAEATNRTPPWRVQVLDARRVAADTVRVEMVVSNLAPAPAAPTEATEAAAFREALAAFAKVSVVTADGRRRLFPLHDSAGRMAWSGLEPPDPGQHRSIWVLFPAPVGDDGRLTLVVPGLAPLQGIPVSKGSGGFSADSREKAREP